MLHAAIRPTAEAPGLAAGALLLSASVTSSRTHGPDAWPDRGLARWQVRKVAEYVQANLDRAMSLAELAALVRLSRFHFCTAFRLATGMTPGEWVTEARIGRAVELLEAQELSITQIALEVGYETPSSFTARFRQRMGMTPSQYRRRL
jgi:AraC family transcriptional regulator